jgi:predicted Zn-dependent peptidase
MNNPMERDRNNGKHVSFLRRCPWPRTTLLVLFIFALTSSSIMTGQSRSTPSSQMQPRTATEAIQPPVPRLVGDFRSRQDNGPFTKIIWRNELVLLIKEHHATPLASVSVLIKIPSLAPTSENEFLLRLAAKAIFPGVSSPDFTRGDSGLESLGGITESKVLPDSIRFTVTFPTEVITRIYPFITRGLSTTNLNVVALEQAQLSLRRDFQPLAKDDQGRNQFLVAGFPAKFSMTEGSSQNLLNSLNQFLRNALVGPNIVVAVVGDIDRERVIEQISKNLLSVPAPSSPKKEVPTPPSAAPQFHYELVPTSVGPSGLELYFSAKSTPPAILAQLSALLTHGETSYLKDFLVTQRPLATSVSSRTAFIDRTPYLLIRLSCPHESLDEASIFLFARLQQFVHSNPTPDEMLRARQQITLSWNLDDRTPSSISEKIVEYESNLGWFPYTRMMAEIEKVTADEVRNAAEEMFQMDRAFVIERWPLGQSARTFTPDTYQTFISLALPRALPRLAKSVEVAAAGAQKPPEKPLPYAGDFDRTQLKAQEWTKFSILRGPSVYVKEFHISPLVTIEALYPGGQLVESRDHAGLTELMTLAAIQSLKDKTHNELWFELESLGATIEPINDHDLFGYALITPRAAIPTCIEILLKILLEPQFSPGDVVLSKARMLQDIKSRLETSHDVAIDRLTAEFFKHADMYSSLEEQLHQISKWSEKDVVAWWNHLQKDTLPSIVILGDTEGTEFVTPFARRLSSSRWKSPAFQQLSTIMTPKLPALFEESFPMFPNSSLAIGFPGPNLISSNSMAIELGRWVFRDLFEWTQVDDFHYLRLFSGIRRGPDVASAAHAQSIVKQMDSLLASDEALTTARRLWMTDSMNAALDPRADGVNLFRRTIYFPDMESIHKAEPSSFSPSTVQLREALKSIFNAQNTLNSLITPRQTQ